MATDEAVSALALQVGTTLVAENTAAAVELLAQLPREQLERIPEHLAVEIGTLFATWLTIQFGPPEPGEEFSVEGVIAECDDLLGFVRWIALEEEVTVEQMWQRMCRLAAQWRADGGRRG